MSPNCAARAAIYAKPNVKITFVPSLSSRDCAVGLMKGNHSKWLVVSLYCDINQSAVPLSLKAIVNHCVNERIKLLLCADTNAHSFSWNSADENRRGIALEEYLESQNINVENKGIKPTFIGAPGRTIVDITATLGMLEINPWFVSDTPSLSDHALIRFTVTENATFKTTPGRDYLKADWSKFSYELGASMAGPLPDNIWTRAKIEHQLDDFYNCVNNALNIVCPLKPVKVRSTMIWWNERCQESRKNLRRTQKLANKHPNNQLYQDDFKACRRRHTREIKKAKKESWRKFVGEVGSMGDTSRLWKALKGPSDRGEIGLMTRPDGTLCADQEENLTYILTTFFPSASPAPSEAEKALAEGEDVPIALPEKPEWLSIARMDVGIAAFSPHKSAGLDGLKPIVIKHLPLIAKQNLLEIFHACIKLHYVPDEWTKSKVIFIKKPGKTDLNDPRTFRPISLTSFLFKLKEKMVGAHLNETTLRDMPMHPNQHAFRKGHSTENALSELFDKVEQALLKQKFAIIVFCDIKGAFDNMCQRAIIASMRKKNVPPDIIGWYEFYLNNRLCESTAAGVTVILKVTDGSPQGGVLSPTLGWNLPFDDLLSKYDWGDSLAMGFADDGAMAQFGSHLPTVRDLAQRALDKAVDWAVSCGLELDKKKTVAMIFTRKRKWDMPDNITLYGSDIKYVMETKYLGLTVDYKLTWVPHILNKIKKAKSLLNASKHSIRKIWGPKPRFCKWAYTGMIRPMITYGCYIWAKAATTQVVINKLQQIQRLAMMGIASIRQATPTMALELLYDIIPLDLFIRQTATKTHIRLGYKITWPKIGDLPRNWGHRHFSDWLLPENLKPDKLTKDSIVEYTDFSSTAFTFNIGTGGDITGHWTQGLGIVGLPDLKCYTDGSLMDGNAGAGVSIWNRNRDEICVISSKLVGATVFQAEIIAIRMAAETITNWLSPGSPLEITFLVDSQAAILAIQNRKIHSKTVAAARTSLGFLQMANLGGHIHFEWIRAHSGFKGNEAADNAAKRGGKSKRGGFAPPKARCTINRELNNLFISEWQIKWDTFRVTEFRRSRIFIDKPNKRRAKDLLDLSRLDAGRLVRWVTGHAFLRRQNAIVAQSFPRPAGDIHCRSCDDPDMDEEADHIINECEAFCLTRHTNFGKFIIDGNHFDWSVDNLLNFLRSPDIIGLEVDE
jgi:ribonuclease HI